VFLAYHKYFLHYETYWSGFEGAREALADMMAKR